MRDRSFETIINGAFINTIRVAIVGSLLALLLASGAHADDITNPTAPTLAGTCLVKNGITISLAPGGTQSLPPAANSNNYITPWQSPYMGNVVSATVYSPTTYEVYHTNGPSNTNSFGYLNLLTGIDTSSNIISDGYPGVFNATTGRVCIADSNNLYQIDPSSHTVAATTTWTYYAGTSVRPSYDSITGYCLAFNGTVLTNNVLEIDRTGTVVYTTLFDNGVNVRDSIYSPATRLTYILTGNNNGTIIAFNSASHTYTSIAVPGIGIGDYPSTAVFDPDNNNVYFVSAFGGNLYWIDTSNTLHTVAIGGGYSGNSGSSGNSISYSSTSKHLYIDADSGLAYEWDTISNTLFGRKGTFTSVPTNLVIGNYLVRFSNVFTYGNEYEVDPIFPYTGGIPGQIYTTQSAITVGSSPFTYTNNTINPGDVLVVGGTVSAQSFVRNTVSTPLNAGSGHVTLMPGDALTVTYTAAPTMTFIPLH